MKYFVVGYFSSLGVVFVSMLLEVFYWLGAMHGWWSGSLFVCGPCIEVGLISMAFVVVVNQVCAWAIISNGYFD